MGVKLKADYSAVLHMPVLKEGKDRVPQHPGSMQGYTQPGPGSTLLLRLDAVFMLASRTQAHINVYQNHVEEVFVPTCVS